MKSLHTIFAIVFSIFTIVSTAQSSGGNYENRLEKINSQKVAFITQEMDLSVEDAQQFWPVYNELNEKLEVVKTDRNHFTRKLMNQKNSMTDEELLELMDKFLQLEKQESTLKLEYHEKYKKLISPKKLVDYYMAEKKFRNHLLNRVKESRRPKR